MLVQKKPGLYFLASREIPNNSNFFVICAPQFEKNVDLKKLSELLKEQGFKGGGKQGTLQGGGGKIGDELKTNITSWLQKQ